MANIENRGFAEEEKAHRAALYEQEFEEKMTKYRQAKHKQQRWREYESRAKAFSDVEGPLGRRGSIGGVGGGGSRVGNVEGGEGVFAGEENDPEHPLPTTSAGESASARTTGTSVFGVGAGRGSSSGGGGTSTGGFGTGFGTGFVHPSGSVSAPLTPARGTRGKLDLYYPGDREYLGIYPTKGLQRLVETRPSVVPRRTKESDVFDHLAVKKIPLSALGLPLGGEGSETASGSAAASGAASGTDATHSTTETASVSPQSSAWAERHKAVGETHIGQASSGITLRKALPEHHERQYEKFKEVGMSEEFRNVEPEQFGRVLDRICSIQRDEYRKEMMGR